MGKHQGGIRQSKRRKLRLWWWAVLLVTVVVGVVFAWRGPVPQREVVTSAFESSSGTAARAVLRRETRPTLDPVLFVGNTRLAHRVAREIPDILDQLYCYCECDKNLGHRSLLSCYTDGHAAT